MAPTAYSRKLMRLSPRGTKIGRFYTGIEPFYISVYQAACILGFPRPAKRLRLVQGALAAFGIASEFGHEEWAWQRSTTADCLPRHLPKWEPVSPTSWPRNCPTSGSMPT